MKIRIGFISNSSSASYIIDTTKLTAIQFKQILNHIKVAKEITENNGSFKRPEGDPMEGYYDDEFGLWNERDEWSIEATEKNILKLETSMTNFSMRAFLEYIKVPDDAIKDISPW